VRVATGTQRPPEVTQQAYATQQAAANRQLTDSNQRISDAQGNQRIAATVAKDLEATRAERCKKARADYQTSIQSRRMYNEDKDGKRTYLNDAQLSQQRVEAAKQVEAICGPQG
jgi:K+-sensing histidine kinase KdpD